MARVHSEGLTTMRHSSRTALSAVGLGLVTTTLVGLPSVSGGPALAAPPVAPAPGLVAAYGFEEASGTTVLDASGSGLSGTISGATRQAVGRHGAGLSFDGVDDKVDVLHGTPLALTTGMTLEAWIRPTASTGWRTVVLKERPGGLAWALYSSEGSGRPNTTIRVGADRELNGASPLPLNTWSHVAATYDGATQRLFVNGTQVASRARTGSLASSNSPRRIGGNTVWNEWFAGQIDEVRVYDRALAAAEIATDMGNPVGPGQPPPGSDTTAPSEPANLTATGSVGTITLDWAASTDAVGVTGYSLHRSTVAGFTPSAGNRIAQPTQTEYDDTTPVNGTTYYYRVTASDAAGNVSAASNQASAAAVADTTSPAVSITSPTAGATVSGNVTVTADAQDNIGVASVQFRVDGTAVGAADTSSPYSFAWDTATLVNGSHSIDAVARDSAGNATTASAVTVTVSNTGPPPPAGLVGAWSFDAGSGTTASDASGLGNHGTLSGATWTGAGRTGGALSFDGVNDRVVVPDAASLDLTNRLTLEAWVRPTASSGWRTVALKEQASGLAYALYSSNGSRPNSFLDIGGDKGVVGPTALVLNTWAHLAVTYDGTTARFYVNGNQVATRVAAGSVATSAGRLSIGGNEVWGEWFAGQIDEMRIYAAALTASQIQTDMTRPVQNQNQPPTNIALSPSSVEEHSPAGTVVGELSATDPDVTDTHTFDLVAGPGATDNASFTIAGRELRTAAVLDSEAGASLSVRVRARDNQGGSFEKELTVTLTDDAEPVAVDDTATVTEDAPAGPINVLANDTDADGGPKTIQSATQPDNGTVAITGAGTELTYEPKPDYCNAPAPADTFTYMLNGGDSATVAVTVACVDDDPAAVDDTATVTADAPAGPINVLANDTDVDGGPKSIQAATQPDNGTVAITGGGTELSYQPDPSYCNDTAPVDTFTYALNGGSSATVLVTVTCDVPPTAVDDSATVGEDANPAAIDVLANDQNPDGGPKRIASVTQPGHGTVVLTGGSAGAHAGATYGPDPDYCNSHAGADPDTFDYTMNGGSSATVSIIVTCAPDNPTARDDSATADEDSAAASIDVLVNDTDPDGDAITIASTTQPEHGSVALVGGTPGAHTGLTYEPDRNYCNSQSGGSPDTFVYTVDEGDTATVSVTVTCVTDEANLDNSAGASTYTEGAAPVVVDGLITVTNPDGLAITGGSTSISANYAAGQDVLAWADNDTGDSITQDAANSTARTMVLTGSGAANQWEEALEAVTYASTSQNPDTVDRVVTFSVTTSAGSPSDTKTVQVAAVDDPPVALDDSATVLEDSGATSVPVLTNDTDADGGPELIASATDAVHGTVVLTGGAPGAHTGLTYQPDPNYCNEPGAAPDDTFSYQLAPGDDTAAVSVAVTCVNDAPVADDETFNGPDSAVGNTRLVVDDPTDPAPSESAPLKAITGDILAGDDDVDGPGPLAVTAGTFATNDGGTVLLESDGDFVYAPAAGVSCTDQSDFFDYTVTDGATPTARTDTGRVTIALASCVWYVNNDDPGNSGTSSAPFDTLAQAQVASSAGHTIFVFDGDDTSAGYSAGIALKNNQRLIGEAADLVVEGTGLYAAQSGKRPTITNTNADVVDLAGNNSIDGFVFDPNGTGSGIAASSGDAGGGTINNVSIVDSGVPGDQPLLEIDGTVGGATGAAFTFTNLEVSNAVATSPPSTATGVRLNSTKAVFDPATAISIATRNAKALDATSTSFVTSTFDDIHVTGSSVGGIALNSTTAASLALGDDVGADLSLTTSGSTAAYLASHAQNVTVGAGGTDTISATGGPAVDIYGGQSGTFAGSYVFDNVDSINSTSNGLRLESVGTGSFSVTDGTIAGYASWGVVHSGGSGNVTIGADVADGAGTNVVVINRSGAGTVRFTGNVSDNADAGGSVALSNNGSTTVLFEGGLNLQTAGSDALSVVNSGTVVVTDPNPSGAPDNRLTTTTGMPLNVQNTTIGADGLNFESISASGAARGIALQNTGTSGGLRITGTDGADAGTLPDPGTGGTIQNTGQEGVSLVNANATSLGGLTVLDTGGDGISMSGGNGLELVTVRNSGAGNALGEHGLEMFNSGGTLSIQNSTFADAEHDLVWIDNLNTNLTVDVGSVAPSTFSHTTVGSNTGNGIRYRSSGTSNLTQNIEESTFTNIKQSAILVTGTGSGANVSTGNNINLNYVDNQFTTTVVNTPGGANNRGNSISVFAVPAVDVEALIRGNTFSGGGAAFIASTIHLQAEGAANLDAEVRDNTISSPFGYGIAGEFRDDSTTTLLLDGNQVSSASASGIYLRSGSTSSGTSTLNATLTNNVVSGHNTNTGNNASSLGFGIISIGGPEDVTLVDVRGNSVSGNPNPGSYVDYSLNGIGTSPVTLEGPTNSAVTESSFLASTPPNSTTAPPGGRTSIANTFYSGGATAALPVLAP